MLENNNLIPFFFSFLPALFYALLIFMSAPFKSIRMKVAFFYFLMGILSAVMVDAVHYIFPNWRTALADEAVLGAWLYATVQVAMLEEGTKLFMFKIGDDYRKRLLDAPVATMFYCMSVSMGFAVLENLSYLQLYGKDVLFIRAFTAIVMHMITGLMMGYMIAKGQMPGDTIVSSLPARWKSVIFAGFGFVLAAFYHGIYDFNIYLEQFPGNPSYPLYCVIIPGALIAYAMFRDLTWKSYKK